MTARTGNIFSALAFGALAILVFVSSAQLDDRAALFPRIAAGLILVGAVSTLYRAWMQENTGPSVFQEVAWAGIAAIILLFAVALVFLKQFGFPVVAAGFFGTTALLIDLKNLTIKRAAIHVVAAIVFAGLATALFIGVLGVSLPLGLLANN